MVLIGIGMPGTDYKPNGGEIRGHTRFVGTWAPGALYFLSASWIGAYVMAANCGADYGTTFLICGWPVTFIARGLRHHIAGEDAVPLKLVVPSRLRAYSRYRLGGVWHHAAQFGIENCAYGSLFRPVRGGVISRMGDGAARR